jgi:lipopolysaccharide transport system ATP-binding protein
MQGEAFRVVKAYEEYLHGPIESLAPNRADPKLEKRPSPAPARTASLTRSTERQSAILQLQEPEFRPHSQDAAIPDVSRSDLDELHHQAPGGVSRWNSEKGLKITGFTISSAKGIGNKVVSLQPARFTLLLSAECDGDYDCRYGIALHDLMGHCVTRVFSPGDRFTISEGGFRRVELTLNPLQLGPGEYTVGISVLENGPLEKLNSAKRFDLLSRSFSLSVGLPDSMGVLSCAFFHTGEWSFCAPRTES